VSLKAHLPSDILPSQVWNLLNHATN
jgi:hypothetical protein